jgi:hypothetical protein
MLRPHGVVLALALLGLAASATVAAPPPGRIAPGVPGKPTYRCGGSQITLFDNSNTGGVLNGGTAPTFSTKGKAYCLSSLGTYHWNNAQGAAPGTIGLRVVLGLGGRGNLLGPLAATGSPGQGGAPDVNWTAAAAQPIVLNGTYACVDSNPPTWAQNQASGGHGFCTVTVTTATPTKPVRPARPTYTCSGAQQTLLDDSNGGGVQNGGTPPPFSTYGTIGVSAYCLNSIVTYHWNDGHGERPGMLGLSPLAFAALQHPVPPRRATGSSGQGGAPNVNWTVNFPGRRPTVISGIYACRDSSPKTWSSNQASHGHGFCHVMATPAYVSGFSWPGGTFQLPPPPPPQPASPPSGGHIRCFTGTLSSMLLYPIHVAPDAWGLLLLHCNIPKKDGFQGRLTPSSLFVIDRGCGPFWTYPFASGNPPPPVFLHYTGQPNSPCANAQIFVPFKVDGPWRVDYRTRDASSGTPLRPGAYGVFVRYPGGDVQAQNTLNVP